MDTALHLFEVLFLFDTIICMNIPIDISNVILKTDRLTLREWSINDVDDMFEYASVPGVGERAGWTHHKDKDESKRIINMFIKGKNIFAITYNNKVIGSLGIEETDQKFFPELVKLKTRELGFVLSKDYWGKGLVPEACKAVIDYLFNIVKVDAITCFYYKGNNQSKRVQEKLGFTHYREVECKNRMGETLTSCGGILYKEEN